MNLLEHNQRQELQQAEAQGLLRLLSLIEDRQLQLDFFLS
jgi:hypothetical protein